MQQTRSGTGRVRYLAALAAAIAGAWALGQRGGELLALERWGRGAGRAPPAPLRGGRVEAAAPRGAPVAPSSAGAPARAADVAGQALPAPAGGVSAAVAAVAPDATPEQREAAARLAESVKRLVRDLEYNTEFPEPPQQTVVAPPAPWRPPPESAAAEPPEITELQPRAVPAAGGALVRIRGRNLRPAQVMFGHVPARILNATSAEVAVMAPPASEGEVTVALTNDDGTFALAREPLTYRR